MELGDLGSVYGDGEVVVREGDTAENLFIIQKGEVEVVLASGEGEHILSVLGEGDIFGEMSLFTKEPRSASVRVRGEARILTVDKRGFLRRIHEDPFLAFRILQKMSQRILALNREVLALKGTPPGGGAGS